MVGVCAGCCAGWWPSWAASWAQARGTRKGQGHRTPLPPPLWCVLGRFIMDAERAVAQAGRMHRPACCTARSGVCTHAATTVRAASMVGGRWLGRWCMPGCCRWWCEQGRTTWPMSCSTPRWCRRWPVVAARVAVRELAWTRTNYLAGSFVQGAGHRSGYCARTMHGRRA